MYVYAKDMRTKVKFGQNGIFRTHVRTFSSFLGDGKCPKITCFDAFGQGGKFHKNCRTKLVSNCCFLNMKIIIKLCVFSSSSVHSDFFPSSVAADQQWALFARISP